ncbi:extensin family protein [Mesorhizobium sp. M2D.F.Ca.ET.185.01.1.1]|nr:extensin family protein [Mesorhizobium sp. M2D.F.Ca.ET.140.01.1.1]TGP18769.1 extensin family protein [Mesorhizobium sp. M2D.F.Ca.ET.233.01.1.1]TGP36037.1 extensin family protein [Mesorhizobium sp. M2D.F.Ca.ET.232.01.1.1]TGP61539.1 extensin family protein [Mesorhizobium sp. M2D.F.Ca.ET.226.01.1.1]TGP70818.1 extensin family protein [Mesorhizobium sp. M2D.F.Ca.ET.225.01.1.1]TGP78794.1 extensin family protein [Mesorhizobium sp. M2D.F.Ca.ET.224.01.1.1]TGP82882.1 extensin family protein [bacteri
MPLAAAALLATPAMAKHHHRHKGHLPPTSQSAAPAAETLGPRLVPGSRPEDMENGADKSGQGKPRANSNDDFLNQEKSHPKWDARPPRSKRAESKPQTESEPQTPDVVPTPPQKPAELEPEPPETAPQPPEKPAQPAEEEKMLPDPRSAAMPADTMPAEETACRERLKALGVEFEEHKAEHDPEIGCAIPYPIVIKTLGKSIGISSGTELNCQMAEATARFMADVVQPMAKAEFGADLKSVNQASAFVCRPRNGTRKLSEHAFGNALDIASFTLSDGTRIEIGPAPPEKDGKFLDAVRKAACGPFKTVLGPGADPDHALHFHLDLEPRRHGGTFCQ